MGQSYCSFFLTKASRRWCKASSQPSSLSPHRVPCNSPFRRFCYLGFGHLWISPNKLESSRTLFSREDQFIPEDCSPEAAKDFGPNIIWFLLNFSFPKDLTLLVEDFLILFIGWWRFPLSKLSFFRPRLYFSMILQSIVVCKNQPDK